jgi:PPP family 3-phenylpropionic acid transporter
MLGAVKPLTTFIVAPFWGILSDGTGDRFRILYFTFLVSVVGQILVAVRHDFYYLVVMVFVTAFFNAPVKSLIDSMVMDNLPDRRYYGRLRLWGQMGFGLGSSGAGILLSKSKGVAESMLSHHSFLYKCWQNLTGYKLLFFTYAALSIPTWMCLKAFERIEKEKQVTVTKKAHKEGARIGQGLKLLVHNADALLFFFLVFVVGVSSGCIENFAYVRMREVGGSGKEMGLSRLVSSVAGAPMFWFSGPLTEMLGADRVLSLSLLSYAVRFFIYAFMRNPYHGLPAEAMRGVTFAAFWSTSTIYAHRISPPGMSATMVRFPSVLYDMMLIFNRTDSYIILFLLYFSSSCF